MTDGPTISTHVLDVENGQPASGVNVFLYRMDGSERRVGMGTTDGDGRIRCAFRVEDTSRSYHVPLLLGAYSLTTYRGS